ncbi:hypothetical protein [Derxia gummosa]|uniref:Uncharacterized protein n=1 Tax=Derxia gummosa DSM 723 TaxID=1121388 RepID=A0A8B6XCA2_9BURK|nr:hypothetical protein [Derxia gummosa]
MRVTSKIKDGLRTAMGVRVERSLPPAGAMPAHGAHIARADVRIRVTAEMTPDLWEWLTVRGWREIDLSSDRRRYRVGKPSATEELAFCSNDSQRSRVEQHVMDAAEFSYLELARKPQR